MVWSGQTIISYGVITAQERRQQVAVCATKSVTKSATIDELGRQCELPIATVSATLALLELKGLKGLKGLVRQAGSMHYVLARETRAAYAVA